MVSRMFDAISIFCGVMPGTSGALTERRQKSQRRNEL
jgi:hypothetical protein